MRSDKRREVGLMNMKVTSRKSPTMKKKVSQKAKGQPPALDISNTWRAGDVVEVFDKASWKIAVFYEVIGKFWFLVRPIGSSRELKVRRANIRERVSWRYNSCDSMEKDFVNRMHGESNESSNVKYDKKQPLQIRINLGPNDADRITCSVGSCSAADMNEFPFFQSRDQIRDDNGEFIAESVLQAEDKNQNENMAVLSKGELEDEIHKLELDAYCSTMEALHVAGPFSWEKEELLTNLRISLHITNDEHLLDKMKTCLEARGVAEDSPFWTL